MEQYIMRQYAAMAASRVKGLNFEEDLRVILEMLEMVNAEEILPLTRRIERLSQQKPEYPGAKYTLEEVHDAMLRGKITKIK